MHTHSSRLERWLGTSAVEEISQNMKGWYGPPIAVDGVPGAVFATKDGDFIGECRAGWEATGLDHARDVVKRLQRAARIATSPRRAILHAGFSSLEDLIEKSRATRQECSFSKIGTTGLVGFSNSLWGVGTIPVAGAIGSAAPGGRAPDMTTTGAFVCNNPPSGFTRHFVGANILNSTGANYFPSSLLLYDRIFDVAKNMNSATPESVTGVPTRYQSSTPGAMDYAGGNFLFMEVITTLAATAHIWTASCLYRNQAGTDAQALPALTGISGAIANRLDHNLAGQWFAPLAAGDTGIMDLNQLDLDVAVATGTAGAVIGHPIAWLPVPVMRASCYIEGINTAMNLVRIFNDAALALLEITKATTFASTYNGSFTTVSG